MDGSNKTLQLTRFTQHYWEVYAGAVSFDNDSAPFVGWNLMVEIVADKSGLTVYPYYDDSLAYSGGWKLNMETEFSNIEKMTEMLTKRILEETATMFPVEINQYLREKGFNILSD